MKNLVLAGLILATFHSYSEVSETIEKEILVKLRSGPEKLHYESVFKTPIDDIFRVSLKNGKSIYTNKDGSYVFSGELFSVQPGKFVNLSAIEKAQDRLSLLSRTNDSDILIYPAIGDKVATINVFTDVDCPYCAKLHGEIPNLNVNGIEVRYFAYPRAGLNTPSYSKIATVWCSENPKQLLLLLQMGKVIELVECENNSVDEHYFLAKQMGVPGTPTIVFEDGTMISGYRSAEELTKITNKIQLNKKAD